MSTPMIVTLTLYMDNTIVTLPLTYPIDTNIDVDWGDGISETIIVSSTSINQHTYVYSGTYTVTLTGNGSSGHFGSIDSSTFSKYIDSIDQFGDIGITDMSYACNGAINLSYVDYFVENFTNLSYMFLNCTSLSIRLYIDYIPLVTSMKGMFMNCVSFNNNNKPLPIYTTNLLKDVSNMFSGCTAFNTSILISDTSSITSMSGMFKDCGGSPYFTTNTNFNSVIDMSNMFNGCIHFSSPCNFVTSSSLKDISNMFTGCGDLISPVTITNTTGVTSMKEMFMNCYKFNQPINFVTTNSLNDISNMFTNCYYFDSDVTITDTTGVTSMKEMFMNCNYLTQFIKLNISGIQSGTTTDFNQALYNMFMNTSLSTYAYTKIINYLVDISTVPSYIDLGTVSNIYDGTINYYDIYEFRVLDSLHWNIVQGIKLPIIPMSITLTFNYNSITTVTLPLSYSVDTSLDVDWGDGTKETIIVGINTINQHTYRTTYTQKSFTVTISGFGNNGHFGSIDSSTFTKYITSINDWGAISIIDFSYALNGAVNLTSVPLIPADIINMSYMFANCTSLTDIVYIEDASKVTSMNSMFKGCIKFNQPIFIGTSSTLTDISNMFSGCTIFNSEVIITNTTGVIYMDKMFMNCYAFNQVIKLNISGVQSGTSSELNTSMYDMFMNTGLSSYTYTAIIRYVVISSNIPSYIDLGTVNNYYTGLIDYYDINEFTTIDSNNWNIVQGVKLSIIPMSITITFPNNSIKNVILPLNYIVYTYIEQVPTYIDWGDGTTETVLVSSASITQHMYTIGPTQNSFTVTISGFGNDGKFGSVDSSTFTKYMSSINQWGTIGITNFSYACNDAIDLVSVPPIPYIVNNTSYMFNGCTGLTDRVTIEISTNLTNMNSMFKNCINFNQPVNFTTTKSLTDISNMFSGCSSLNSLITITNTSSVIYMNDMFRNCSMFNQPINFITSKSLTDISNMFLGCSSLNSIINITNTSGVNSMYGMFMYCISFNTFVKLNVSGIIGGVGVNGCSNSMYGIFSQTNLSIDIYSSIVNYFVNKGNVPSYLNLGDVTNINIPGGPPNGTPVRHYDIPAFKYLTSKGWLY